MSDEEISVPDFFPVAFALPQSGTHKKCPACGSRQIAVMDSEGEIFASGDCAEFRVEYHRYGVLGAPCGERFNYDELKELGPHLCKTCSVCGFGWSESVNTNGA